VLFRCDPYPDWYRPVTATRTMSITKGKVP
jgi:hypothetical protein